MADRTVIIDVVAQFVDHVSDHIGKAENSIKQLETSTKKAKKSLEELGSTNAKPKVDAEDSKFLRKIRQAKAKADQLGKTKVSAVLGAVDKATTTIGKVATSAKNFASNAYNAFLSVRDNEAMQSLREMGSKLQGLAGTAWRVTVSLVDKITQPIRSIMSKLSSLTGMVGLGLSTYGLVINPTQTYADYEDLFSQYKIMLGSAEAAQQRIDELTAFAGETPNTRDEIYQASKILQNYTKGAAATPDTGLRTIGNVAAATGVGYVDVADRFGKMYSLMASGASITDQLDSLTLMGALTDDARTKLVQLAEATKSGTMTMAEAWPQILDSFSQYDGLMEDMSNNTNNLLLGVKSFFKNNVIMKIGSGIASQLDPFLKRFRTWRNENSELIKNMGAGIEKFAADVSGKALGAVEKLASKIWEVANTDAFKNADFFGKIEIMWDEVIAKPFSNWWDSKGKKWFAEKAENIGKGIGEGVTFGVAALFGLDLGGAVTEGTSIGASFAEGFTEGFDGSKVAESIWEGFKSFFKQHPILGLMLGGVAAGKTAGLVNNVIGLGSSVFGLGKSTVSGVGSVGGALKGIGETAYLKGLYFKDWITGGSTGAKIVGTAGKFLPLAAGLTWAGADAYKGYGNAQAWLGEEAGSTTSGKVSSVIGGALGGSSSGIGGALKGAGKGALSGAGIGSIIPGLGTVVGGAVGGVVGAVGGAVGGERISKGLKNGWESTKDWFKEAGESAKIFFTETLPEKWDEVTEPISTFFTETIPEKWNDLTESLDTLLFETIPEKLGELFGKAQVFFTETIPEKWDEFTEAAATLFTETIPEKWDSLMESVTTFFTETIPEKWNEMLDVATTFFTETIPEKWNEMVDSATTFFTETISEKWNEMVDIATTFFTETIPEKWNSMVDIATTFFTETIPEKWNSMVDTATSFFTETLPGMWESVQSYWNEAADTISSGWDSVKSYFMEKADAIGSWFSEKKTWITEKWNTVKNSFNKGKESVTNNAAGGMVSGRTLSWLAEEGTPEMVIPLGAHRRKSALDLWKRTGRYLGVQEHAAGGLVGKEPISSNSYSVESGMHVTSAGGNNIEVNVGGITIEVKSENGQSLLEAIRTEKGKIAEEIAGVFAEILDAQFANTPLKA